MKKSILMADDIFEYWMSLARQLAVRFSVEDLDSIWKWEHFKEDVASLTDRLGILGNNITILGLKVNLLTGESIDLLTGRKINTNRLLPYLYYYSQAKDEGIADEWDKFGNLRGSWACQFSFNEEDLNSLRTVFVEKREQIFKAIEKLGGLKAEYGDASYGFSFLPKVKVLIVFEKEDDEFPASVRLLYDKNSIFYQPHEMLGSIASFLANRVAEVA